MRPVPYPLMHDFVCEHLWTVWGHTKHELLILRGCDGWMTHVLAICPGSQLGISGVERADWRSLKTCRGCLGGFEVESTHTTIRPVMTKDKQWQTVKHFASLGVPLPNFLTFNCQFLSISHRWHMLIWYDMIWDNLFTPLIRQLGCEASEGNSLQLEKAPGEAITELELQQSFIEGSTAGLSVDRNKSKLSTVAWGPWKPIISHHISSIYHGFMASQWDVKRATLNLSVLSLSFHWSKSVPNSVLTNLMLQGIQLPPLIFQHLLHPLSQLDIPLRCLC